MEHNSMKTQLIEATIFSIEKRKSQAGKEAVQIICKHPDGTQWGEKIRDWISLDTDFDFVWTRWAKLVKEKPSVDDAKQILMGDDFSLIGLEVQLEVEESDYGKRVKGVWPKEKKGTLADAVAAKNNPQYTANIPDDDIPF